MKLIYLTVRKTRLLIVAILLLGGIAIAVHDHVCYKKGNLEAVTAVYRIETEQGKPERD